jgi:hypothetical protein
MKLLGSKDAIVKAKKPKTTKASNTTASSKSKGKVPDLQLESIVTQQIVQVEYDR